MVLVFGNSCERVPIKDLNDAIYYRQKKQYTDQEFNSSKDLQREIQKGRIIKLEQVPEIRGSLPDTFSVNASVQARPSIDLSDIRRVITEVVAEHKSEGMDLKGLVTNLIPVIAETVRQEVSKVQVGARPESIQENSSDIQVSYVPEVKMDGLKSNITIESTQVQGQEVTNSLELLKKLKST